MFIVRKRATSVHMLSGTLILHKRRKFYLFCRIKNTFFSRLQLHQLSVNQTKEVFQFSYFVLKFSDVSSTIFVEELTYYKFGSLNFINMVAKNLFFR